MGEQTTTVAAAKGVRGTLLGAMFLMATSAIGPGFITQTATFTGQLGAAFAFAIVASILVDLAVQLNVWRIIGVSGLRAQELANRVVPGAGHLLSFLVVLGGLVFNIGNVAGAGLGGNALLGVDPTLAGVVSALVAIAVFVSKRAGVAMDRVVVVLGVIMIGMTAYVAVVSDPPVGSALHNAVLPDKVDFAAITTLIGGTVGGYITYAGAHRLVDSGVSGPAAVRQISRSSITGILVTGVMRALLFLAVLGVVAAGVRLSGSNPAATAFEHAAGQVGLRIFGLVLWAAAITSVIGAAYTSVSFLTGSSRRLARHRNSLVIGFIAVSTTVFVLAGQAPVTLLVFAGAFNGLILPVGLGLLLWVAARRRDLMRGYRYPRWLVVLGVLAWLVTVYLGWKSLGSLGDLWK
ncbi:NRAMP family divalent metal transporter [Streptoalloteichus hindustanus]|uniref:Mn2+ and Fe2+ transporters of the NRAMP family n=1 Tax=Streptoalloteichus hindustanus TaxID=2017 RepID=A0A1M5B258_STRHI|nr:NRAMP family divalent metal transporter [Streptoalloteichus hindustanus]SHF36496.1 Mn2+ and Fe2+ transporters of the NRAMP family [Streptoalloteichus hindustanus]